MQVVDLTRSVPWLKPTSLHNGLPRNVRRSHRLEISFLGDQLHSKVDQSQFQQGSLVLKKHELVACDLGPRLKVKKVKSVSNLQVAR